MMLSSLCGSETRGQSRHGAVASTKETALFVREIKAGVPPPPQQQPGGGYTLRENKDGDDGTSLHKGVMLESKVDATLTITSTDSKMNTWLGFKSQSALFLRGNGWDDMDIRQSVVAALDLAEEQLGCHTVYLCLEKSNEDLAKLVRSLMYAGFEVVHPGVLAQADPKYLIMGMEL
ncbi:hypothetical protein EMPS_05970 [Entomortierella parvispora]|uniref:Ornithine decarboxylase antizyme n=1 Tax=Entomortierella parvispora TaxID=205924 RepID=A0A9P3LX10_9FUNG|nr:hypothetical protein EMPS_05970 [Entomortierella parvispora]